jgi:hypothetical protein
MDEILYLEPDEEITSVIDKLRQATGRRISLVVPREATILQSVINLKLLAKEAANLQKEIGIVTADKIGRNLAAQVGLTVYESLKNPRPIYEPPSPEISSQEIIEVDMSEPAKKIETPHGLNVHHFQDGKPLPRSIERNFEAETKKFIPAPTVKTPHLKTKRHFNWDTFRKFFLPSLIIVVALALTGSYFLLPKVKVSIKVISDNFQKSQEVKVGDAVNTDPQILTGTFVESISSKEEKFSATGKKDLGGKAAGTITVYNNLDSNSHNFAAGAKLSSSGKTFVFRKAVVVPGAGVSSGKIVPGTVSAEIEAEKPGAEYNVSAGRFTIIDLPAAQQEVIYGQSTKDLTGGFSKEVQVISQDDYDKAKVQILSELNAKINQDVQKQTEGLVILDKALLLEQTGIKTSANVNDQATDFTMSITERGRVIAYSEENFKNFVINLTSAQLPSDKMLTLGPDDKIVPVVKEIRYDQKILILNTDMTAKLSSRLDVAQIKNDLLGKNKTAATNLLVSIGGIESYEINFTPAWWPLKNIPKYSKSLNIELEYVPKSSNQPVQP